MLDAKGLSYERADSGKECVLMVEPAIAQAARDELARYVAERRIPRATPAPAMPYPGSMLGAAGYAVILILVAYCAGIQLFGVDWFEAGALNSDTGAAGEWWRSLTALTLHVDQEHLLGNLLFGIGFGVLAGRMFGPGVAWLGILVSGSVANTVDMLISPTWHRAVGASTAVFAALGLLAGFGWGQRLDVRDRRLYRWAPLFAGVSLLALLGAGNEHVDVLGHVLGFMTGIALGWGLAHVGLPRRRGAMLQIITGAGALLALGAAWFFALRR